MRTNRNLFTTPEEIEALVTDRRKETRYLDFKASMDANKTHDFLADLAAMANSEGGHILIGIKDKIEEGEAVADQIVGFDPGDFDKWQLKISNQLRDSVEPSLNGVDFWEVKVGLQNVIVAQVRRSWRQPHAVRKDKAYLYMQRSSAGNAHMDYLDLKRSFLLQDTIYDRAKAFRAERLKMVDDAGTEFNIEPGLRYVTHLFPVDMFAGSHSVDFTLLGVQPTLPRPSGNITLARSNCDGLYCTTRDNDYDNDLVILFRNGAMEALLQAPETDIINAWTLLRPTFRWVWQGMKVLSKLAPQSPILVAPALLGVSRKRLVFVTNDKRQDEVNAEAAPMIRRAALILPEIEYQSPNLSFDQAIEGFVPLVEAVCQTAGIANASPGVIEDVAKVVPHHER